MRGTKIGFDEPAEVHDGVLLPRMPDYLGIVETIDVWEPLPVVKGSNRLRITATPGNHGPGILGKLLPPVMGSVLEFYSAEETPEFRLYISGDTLVYDKIREIPKHFPDLDLALLDLGGTMAFFVMVTMDGKQGVEMMRIVNPRKAIPIPYYDYTMFKSPIEDFKREVDAAGLTKQVHYLAHGEEYRLRMR